ncbi:MAG TPA: glycosyltransferase family 2 protein [Ignavibacteria bacterium]|nr:glycosyltransferase family 2 protein [Ignavibacteria bacterium]HMQ99107.1 glycosyltransferase family 2 protein [Ignavibacteria bacterium]
MTDISVIIVTWNSRDEIVNCVSSVISALQGFDSELIIIDNNSQDDSFAMVNKIDFPKLNAVQNSENLGYTKAINQGIKLSKGKYVLLLNPDTALNDSSIKVMYDFLEANPGYGACAPLMKNPDGSVQYSVRNFPTYWRMFCEFSLLAYIFPKTRLFGSWKAKYMDYSLEQDIEQPMAAAFMVRSELLAEIDNMDERFRMFFNDVDLCKKIYDAGFKIKLLPSSVVTHEHGASIKKDRANMIRVWNDDCGKYFEKHFGKGFMLIWLKINLKISGIIRVFLTKK